MAGGQKQFIEQARQQPGQGGGIARPFNIRLVGRADALPITSPRCLSGEELPKPACLQSVSITLRLQFAAILKLEIWRNHG
jgi:hypothetical protein